MSWTNEASAWGAGTERDFTVAVGDKQVPGVYWSPAEPAQHLVLLGHGGTTHKRIEYLVQVAEQLVARGIAAMAIDGPGHGDRAIADLRPEQFEKNWAAGGGNDGMLEDWRAALDFIEAEFGARPTGWWGLSMGTMMGLPVTATDDRIQVALLGLMGTWGPNGEDLRRLAPQIQCPIRFLVQWDDEIVPRDACLELFGLIGTKRKTLHANPGAHADVPTFEVDASVEYLAQFLAKASA